MLSIEKSRLARYLAPFRRNWVASDDSKADFCKAMTAIPLIRKRDYSNVAIPFIKRFMF